MAEWCTGRLTVGLAIAALAGCAGQKAPPAGPVAMSSCPDAGATTRGWLDATAAWSGETPKGYWDAAGNADPASRVTRLSQDYDAYLALMDRIAREAQEIRQCEPGKAIAGPDQNTALGKALAARSATLRSAADRLLAALPASRARFTTTQWAISAPVLAYAAVSEGTVLAAPKPDAEPLAPFRRGARLEAAGLVAPAGWIAIELNDGSHGYVRANETRPLTPNRSAVTQADRAASARGTGGDPLVAVSLALRNEAPQRCSDLMALVRRTPQRTELAASHPGDASDLSE